MAYVSSAQNQEDILLWRALRNVRDGFYIDVGAADPASLSVTRLFYEQGWRGINLEPNAAYFANLSKARPRDINLPIGAGKEAGQFTFYNVGDSGLSTFDPAIAATHKANGWSVTEHTIEVMTLAEICRKHRPHGPIHFLKIDVEGAEGDVLAGADFKTFRPWVVLLEAAVPTSQTPSYAEWEPVLTGQGYSFAWYDGLNRFYIADEKKADLEQYFQVQPNIFDEFVPASALLERAEHAERALREAQAHAVASASHHDEAIRQTSEALRQTSEALLHSGTALAALSSQAAEAHQQNVALNGRFEEFRSTSQATEQQLRLRVSELESQLTDARLQYAALAGQSAAMEQQLQQVLVNHRQLQQHADTTEAFIRAMRSSTSWRLTAPYRLIGRVLRPEPRRGAIAPTGKMVARKVFHGSMRRLLAMPGMRRSVPMLYRLAPAPVEWLSLRYRAYEQRPPVLSDVPELAANQQTPAIESAITTDSADSRLSDDEVRILRQLLTSCRVTPSSSSRLFA